MGPEQLRRVNTDETIPAMDCDRVFEVLYLADDPGFDSVERLAYHVHLDLCGPCRDRAVFSQQVIRLFRQRSERVTAPYRLRVRILRSFAHRREV